MRKCAKLNDKNITYSITLTKQFSGIAWCRLMACGQESSGRREGEKDRMTEKGRNKKRLDKL